MNFLTIVALTSIFYFTSARPGYLVGTASLVGPAAPGVLLKGPSSATTLLGPDGSSISATAIGGTVAAAPQPGGVVTAAAVAPGFIAADSTLAAPTLSAPLWNVPALSTSAKAVLAGPSGTIISPGLGIPIIAGPTKLWGYY